MNINPAIPKFASDNRSTGTADENKAVVLGTLGSGGTYTVDEATKTITQHVEASTFPNWNGQDQKRLVNSISGDELIYTNPAPSNGAGGSTVLKFMRAR